MPAQPGQDGVWNNMPCTVYSVKTVAGQQFDTIIIDVQQIRVVPDSQVTTTPTQPPVAGGEPHSAPAAKGK